MEKIQGCQNCSSGDESFYEEEGRSDYVRDLYQITGMHCRAAHNLFNLYVKQRYSSITPKILQKMTICVSHLRFKKFINRKRHSVSFREKLRKNERYISINYGRLVCIESMNFKKIFLDANAKALGKDEKSLQENFIHGGEMFGDELELQIANQVYSFENSKTVLINSKPKTAQKEDYFSKKQENSRVMN